MGWDVFISLVLMVSCFTTPFDLAFPQILEEAPAYAAFSSAMDVLFLVDIIINFFSAYEDEYYATQDDFKVIAKTYLRGWFIVDLLAIVPMDWFLPNK